MTHLTGQIIIEAPIDEVFDLVADERNEPRYNPRIVRAQMVSEGPIGTGSRFAATPEGMTVALGAGAVPDGLLSSLRTTTVSTATATIARLASTIAHRARAPTGRPLGRCQP